MARPKHITDVLYSGIGGEKFQDRLAQIRVLREWGEVVGPRMRQTTRAMAVRNGVLTVAVKGAVWKAEIEFLKEDLRTALNERLGRDVISGIRLTSGYSGRERKEDYAVNNRVLSIDKEVKISTREKRRIENSVAVVTDLELRKAVGAAWESKKRLDESRRLAGWKRCRSCGEYGAWQGGLCRPCALDVVSATSGRTGGSDSMNDGGEAKH